MVNWGFRIKALREARHWTQDELAERSGVGRPLISRIELGDLQSYKEETLQEFAKAFGMTTGALAQFLHGGPLPSGDITTPDLIEKLRERIDSCDTLPLPLLGYVAAGKPTSAEQVELDSVPISKNYLDSLPTSRLFGLVVSGDSLIGDQIADGDIVVVERNPDIVDGRIYIVRLGTEFVARHLHRENGSVILTSSNGKYARMKVDEVEIQGRVVLSFKPPIKH